MNTFARNLSTLFTIGLIACSCTPNNDEPDTIPSSEAPANMPDNNSGGDVPSLAPDINAPNIPQSNRAEHPPLTSTECKQIGGTIEGDPGDGRTHRPDYRCANGEVPVGSIYSDDTDRIAIEGAVCCPG